MTRFEARLEKFNKMCRSFDAPKEPLPASEPEVVPKPRYDLETVTPRSGLYNVWKRSSNQHDPTKRVNKCVAIGFTYAECLKWIEKRFKTTWDSVDVNAVYYDICPEEDKTQSDPFANPKNFVRGDESLIENPKVFVQEEN